MMQKIISLIFLISLISLSKCDYRDHLNQFLHEFEELSKEHIYVEHVNNLTSITAMRLYVRIEFPERVFHASLQPHVDLFHPELVVKNSQGKSSINIHEYLEGKLVDDPLSRVMLHIKDGIATGSIETSDQEKFFIEPSHRHVKEPHDFHMIAYKLSHVKFNFSKPDEDSGHFCGHESHSGEKGFSEQDFDFMLPKSDSYLEDGFEYARRKRAADIKNRCSLALIGDYKFFEEVNDGEEANTINYMISLVQNIDPLYRRQSMDPSGSDEYKGFGFSIKHIEVVTSPDEDDDDSDSYRYYDSPTSRRDVSGLLKAFAFGEWSNDYCLAHLFTNYDFSGGVLGLAYVASPSPSRVGGICTKTYRDATGRYKHLNVGLTTVQNYGRTLLTSEIVFVTGHEFGHNWGSTHDSDTYPECAPSNNRYMMYPAAVDGSQPNNEYFSPCSIRSIHDVLVRKSDSCFTPAASAVCGNGFVEVGEECDPGMQDTACCESCKLTAGSKCEDLNDVCCKNCVYNSGAVCLETKWESGDSKLCTNDHTCQLNTDNNKYECVPGSNVVDGTSCYDNGSCRNGVCQDVCTYNSKLPCMCEGDNICRQCCKDSEDAECEIFGGGNLLADGKMCGNGNCVQGKCEVGPQDIQEKFWDVIDRISVNAILLWFRNNVVFAVILFTSIFWIPISIFVDWLDDKYDLGVMDDILGSSNAERKREEEKRLVQETSTV